MEPLFCAYKCWWLCLLFRARYVSGGEGERKGRAGECRCGNYLRGTDREGGAVSNWGTQAFSKGASASQLSLAYLKHSRSMLLNLPDFQERLELQGFIWNLPLENINTSSKLQKMAMGTCKHAWARWGPQQPLFGCSLEEWEYVSGLGDRGCGLGEDPDFCLLCSSSYLQNREQCLAHRGCSVITFWVTLWRHKHIHTICENVKCDCIGEMWFWDPMTLMLWHGTIWANIMCSGASHLPFLTCNSIEGLFWKSLTMKENRVDIEPFLVAGPACLACLISFNPDPGFTWFLTSPAFHSPGEGFREVKSVAQEHTAGKWSPSALSDCQTFDCVPCACFSGTSSMGITWELIRDAGVFVSPQTCLKQNLHFNHIPWWSVCMFKFETQCPRPLGSKLGLSMSHF